MTQYAVFTLGYQKRSIEEYVALLQQTGIHIVVDVRENAWSHKSGFSKSALRHELAEAGISYHHAAFAGNPKELRRAADSHEACLLAYMEFLGQHPNVLDEFDALIAGLAGEGQRVCLLCYERHPDDCHRSILLEKWAAASECPPAVRHLGKEGAERFVTV